jgi:uncharacterized protein YuzE
MGLYMHYDPEVDIAMISFENGRALSEDYVWGLIDRHPDDRHLMGFEIWGASKRLPAEMVAALPLAVRPNGEEDDDDDDDAEDPKNTTEPRLLYDPQGDIASISFETGDATSEEHPWGLIDRDRDDGHLMGFVIWEASTTLPAEMVAALPIAGEPHGVAA